MAGKLKVSDVSSLSVPTEVSVPKSIDAAAEVLDGVGDLLSAGQWGTSAIVWAFTYDTGGGRPSKSVKKLTLLNVSEFAALGIRGLSSRPSVIKYRSAWQHAIDNGWAKPAEPGERCVLPEEPFELPKIEHSAAEPATFDEDDAGGRLRDWLRAELSKWPDKYKPTAAHWVREILEKEFNL